MKWNGTKRKVPAGCWTAVRLLIVVSLFGCLGSGIVQKFAEPIDKDDCHMRCKRADMTSYPVTQLEKVEEEQCNTYQTTTC